jgi:hypothetical protein
MKRGGVGSERVATREMIVGLAVWQRLFALSKRASSR